MKELQRALLPPQSWEEAVPGTRGQTLTRSRIFLDSRALSLQNCEQFCYSYPMKFKASQTTKTGKVVHVCHSSVREAELQKEDCFVFKAGLVYIMDIPGLDNKSLSPKHRRKKTKTNKQTNKTQQNQEAETTQGGNLKCLTTKNGKRNSEKKKKL